MRSSKKTIKFLLFLAGLLIGAILAVIFIMFDDLNVYVGQVSDSVLKQISLWGLIGASGVGIFLGGLFVTIYNSRTENRRLKKLQYTMSYLHLCSECEKKFDVAQTLDCCPDCGRPFKTILGHLEYFTRSSRLYFHQCKNCKIQFDNDEEKGICPYCEKPSENIGFEIRDYSPTTFWGNLKCKLGQYLP